MSLFWRFVVKPTHNFGGGSLAVESFCFAKYGTLCVHTITEHTIQYIYIEINVYLLYRESTFIAFNLILEFISVFSFLILVFVFV